MMEEKNKVSLQQGMRTIWVIWAAMIGSLGVYLLIAHFVGEEIKFGEIPRSTYELIRYALMGVGAGILVLARFVRKIILKGGLGATTPNSTPSFHGTVLARYTAGVIISLAMAESVGIFGLVLFLLGRDFKTFYLFLACSALAMYIYRPKMEELEGLSREIGTERTG